MQLLHYTDHGSELAFINEAFPFCYLQGFADYCKQSGSALHLLADGHLVAPVEIKKSQFLTLLQFHFSPLTYVAEKPTASQEQEFLKAAVHFISSQKIAHRIVQPVNYALFSEYPEGSSHAPFGSYVIDLAQPEDLILNNMKSTYRSEIRQAQKLDYETRSGKNEMDAFYALYADTMSRTKAHTESLDQLKRLYDCLPGHVLATNIYIQNQLQGGIFVVYTTYGAYYLHGASSADPLAAGALKLLQYHTMCLLREKQVKRYDFTGARLSDVSGTKLEGIQNFKKRFGGTLVQGHLWKKDISPYICTVYDTLLSLKLKLQGAPMQKDIIDQEKQKL